ncbi:neprilysin-11-like [Prorops nasuta]|uniref:neprilysin-11-like n=1 Tax=Prorops nasuta TaxID=863751 RepID=UPI0034CF0F07
MTVNYISFFLKCIIVFIFLTVPIADSDNLFCQTKPCIKLGKQLKKELNETFAPCDDLYKFTCDNWIKTHAIPRKHLAINKRVLASKKVFKKIEGLLKKPGKPSKTKAFQMAKDLYKQCNDAENRDKLGITPLLTIIDKFDGWPILKVKSEKLNKIWQDYDKKLFTEYLISGFYNIDVSQDTSSNHETKLIAKLSAPAFPMQKLLMHTRANSAKINAYKDFIRNIISRITKDKNLNISNEDIQNDVDGIVNLQRQIAKMLKGVTSESSKITLGQFQEKYNKASAGNQHTNINWLKIFQETFAKVNINVNDSTEIIVNNVETYFLKLPKLLGQTDSRTIVNYILWRFLVDNVKETDSIATNHYLELNKILMKKKRFPNRSRKCVKNTAKLLYLAIGHEYANKYLSKKTKAKAEELIKNVKETAVDYIKESVWLSGTSKKKIIEKVNAMKIYVGYPDWFTPEAIDNYYADFKIKSGYFESIVGLKKSKHLQNLKKLGQPKDDKFTFNPLSLDDHFYNHDKNEIIYTVTILEIKFNAKLPPVFNYAALGETVAHEIFHTFDDEHHSKHNHTHFIGENDKIVLKEKKRCFANLLHKYTIQEENPFTATSYADNYDLAVHEAFIEAAGLTIGFRAYKKYIETNKNQDIGVSGLETYFGDKLFFILYTNQLCEHVKPKLKDNLRLVIQMTLANSNEFGKTFQCPVGSPMNLKNKCSLFNISH